MLLAPLLAAALVAAAAGALALQRRSQRRLVGRTVVAASANPHVLYFTGESCTVCHVAQRPALRRLSELASGLVIREVDVAREPELARAYRVMTLPTTIVLGRDGAVAAVNAGFAGEALLHDQLAASGVLSAAATVA